MLGFFRRRKKKKKQSKIMRQACYDLMHETLSSVLNKEKTDETCKNSDGTVNYVLLMSKIRTEISVTLNYVARLEKENKELGQKK